MPNMIYYSNDSQNIYQLQPCFCNDINNFHPPTIKKKKHQKQDRFREYQLQALIKFNNQLQQIVAIITLQINEEMEIRQKSKDKLYNVNVRVRSSSTETFIDELTTKKYQIVLEKNFHVKRLKYEGLFKMLEGKKYYNNYSKNSSDTCVNP
eukprot:TRINITY_DN2173_c1_g2_i1.p1 TRINITY_DN2173_c1_g2~~TRINITY_DN2173_c1_g2_i1.p1  ORF type:complete len:151 (-),score=3.20 TRINITY_DN2173_c1_g2_i1:218-670(-)